MTSYADLNTRPELSFAEAVRKEDHEKIKKIMKGIACVAHTGYHVRGCSPRELPSNLEQFEIDMAEKGYKLTKMENSEWWIISWD